MNWFRFVAAFLVAPAAPALLTSAPVLLTAAPSFLVVFLLACFVTYTHAIVLGLPAALLLGRARPLGLWRVLGAAFLIGVLPFGAFNLYHELTMSPGAGYTANDVVLREDGRLTGAGLANLAAGILQCGVLGAVAGLVWWLIAVPRAGRSAHDG